MTNNEIDLLQEEMSKCSNYLEFGSGNSTLMAAQTSTIEKITVVESDPVFWKELVNSNPVIKESVKLKRLRPLLVNIGPTKQWGYPVDDSCQNKWPLYASKAFKKDSSYDLILIDGRFRIACTFQSCLHVSPKTRILIHDFFIRPHYFTIFPFLKLEDKVDTMGVFRIKKNNDPRLIKEYIDIYSYLPGF